MREMKAMPHVLRLSFFSAVLVDVLFVAFFFVLAFDLALLAISSLQTEVRSIGRVRPLHGGPPIAL